MNIEAAPQVERFRSVLGRRLGLSFDDAAIAMLGDTLVRRSGKARLLPAQYVGSLETGGAEHELQSLAIELTTTETYFFRNDAQLDSFCELAPRLAIPGTTSPRLRVLSAACASGEEPYSLAILLKERLPDIAAQVLIVGTDVNARALEAAQRGRYSSWSLRKTTPEATARWFRKERGEFVLDASIRKMVRFQHRNLVEEDAAFFRSDAFDVIFCRNMLMYFTEGAASAVVRRLSSCLSPGGVLFVGHAETWRAACPELELHRAHDAFFFRRRESVSRARERAQRVEPGRWPAAISRSAGRVASLVENPDAPLPAERAAPTRHEPPPAEPAHEDEAGAGARYLKALCRESEGDRRGAMEQATLAVRADPTFSLPHFYLGLLVRRDGDLPQARRWFGQALLLLEREEPSRLLLYGGGFSRDTLVALCRSELEACGARP